MTYTRVIPRDFFNEGKLLKCMGVLSLKILDRQLPEDVQIEIDEPGEPFKIQLTDDGLLTVVNYPVTVNGKTVFMGTVYNSKANFPLFARSESLEDFQVFDDNGDFSSEFIEFAKRLTDEG